MLVQEIDLQLVGPPVAVGGTATGSIMVEGTFRFGCHSVIEGY
jgi:hypothetical protein